MSTEKKDEAGVFYIEKSVCPREFSIAYYGEQSTSPDRYSAMYVTTKSKVTGKDAGPLQVGGGRGANFVLRHMMKEKEVSVDDWEKSAYYIKLASRLTQHKSFVGLNEKTTFTVCVPNIKAEKAKSIWLRFKLERIRNEDSNRVTVYRASTLEKKAKLVKFIPSVDLDEADFAHEFEQVESEDSD